MESVFERIEKLNAGGMKFGTAATRRLLDGLSSPDDGLKIIHIAGTNGKGSVAAYMTQILIAAGKRVGTFTSPFAFDYFEQFSIDGSPMESVRLAPYMERALKVSANAATAFEVLTAGALYAFKEEGCEYAVIECGLGGRDDATNAINKKQLALITSIGLEHTAFLGDTIEKICAHKAGIIRGCPAFASALQPPEAMRYFKHIRVPIADKPLKITGKSSEGQRFLYGDKPFEIKMHGFAQPYNAALAIEGARALNIGERAIYEGLSRTNPGGRLQKIKKGGVEYVLDGGHNPAGFLPLATLLKEEYKGRISIVFGCLSDKDIDGVLQTLEGLDAEIICVSPDSPRAMDIDKIRGHAEKYFTRTRTAQSVASALEGATGIVAVCGSFTILKEAYEWIEKRS